MDKEMESSPKAAYIKIKHQKYIYLFTHIHKDTLGQTIRFFTKFSHRFFCNFRGAHWQSR